RCTVCDHPDRDAVDRALIDGESVRETAPSRGISEDAFLRHRDAHLAPLVAECRARPREQQLEALDAHLQYREEAERVRGLNLLAGLHDALAHLQRFLGACDAWLRDADDPGAYDLSPRAQEVLVTYLEEVDGRIVRRKARLSELLAIAGVGPDAAAHPRHA